MTARCDQWGQALQRGAPVRFRNTAAPEAVTAQVFHVGANTVPCPCCGETLVTLQEMAGLFSQESLIIVKREQA